MLNMISEKLITHNFLFNQNLIEQENRKLFIATKFKAEKDIANPEPLPKKNPAEEYERKIVEDRNSYYLNEDLSTEDDISKAEYR